MTAGSVVQLKSGGPLMTVVRANDAEADCIWMPSPMSTVQRDTFLLAVLQEPHPVLVAQATTNPAT